MRGQQTINQLVQEEMHATASLTEHKAVNTGSILTSNRSRNKHFFYILMGSQMKEMSKRGGKEKTNKEELGLYEIMILRNAHHFSNPKLKEMQLLTHQLLLVVEEVRDLPSDRDSCLCHMQRKPSFLVAVCTV